jgi:hypothetical protein
VLVHAGVRAHEAEAREALAELEFRLREVVRLLPPDRLRPLRKVRFWLEWDRPRDGVAQYHLSAERLRADGDPPELLGGIEVPDLRHFVRVVRDDQPMLLLHELAHAYHHQVLGLDDARVLAAYRQAVERRLYESVPYIHGGRRRAYALTNHLEYFAELSEAYFGQNDYYPFTRADLAEHDPVGYRLMGAAWGG